MRYYLFRKYIHLKQKIDATILRIFVWYMDKRLPREARHEQIIVIWDKRISA